MMMQTRDADNIEDALTNYFCQHQWMMLKKEFGKAAQMNARRH